MEDVVARLSSEGEEFLERLDQEETSVEIREDGVFLAWYDEFDRMIYNRIHSEENVEVGIMLLDEKLNGSVDFLQEVFSYADPENASSTWDFCYETASGYGSEDLETYQAGTVL